MTNFREAYSGGLVKAVQMKKPGTVGVDDAVINHVAGDYIVASPDGIKVMSEKAFKSRFVPTQNPKPLAEPLNFAPPVEEPAPPVDPPPNIVMTATGALVQVITDDKTEPVSLMDKLQESVDAASTKKKSKKE